MNSVRWEWSNCQKKSEELKLMVPIREQRFQCCELREVQNENLTNF